MREKFGLKDGLADKSKVTLTREENGKRIEEETHRVLILDPAAGTGTFLSEVVEHSRQRFEKKWKSGWSIREAFPISNNGVKTDRAGRQLTHEEIEHYRHTIAALAETRTLMAEIDSLISGHGGWPIE